MENTGSVFCKRCGLEVLTEDRLAFLEADREFDGGEFSSAFEPEFCSCPGGAAMPEDLE